MTRSKGRARRTIRALIMDERRLASILRSRAWHEQRSAAGKCHRCPNRVDGLGLYCRRCAIEISQQKSFVKFVIRAAEQKCVECGKPKTDDGLTHKHCRRRKVLNSTPHRRRSSDWPHVGTPVEVIRPLPHGRVHRRRRESHPLDASPFTPLRSQIDRISSLTFPRLPYEFQGCSPQLNILNNA